LAAQAALSPVFRRSSRLLVIGDAWVLKQWPGLKAGIHSITDPDEMIDSPGLINVLHVPHPGIRSLQRGRPSVLSGEVAAQSLRVAAAYCLQGRVQGLLTGPVSKESLHKAGVRFGGQTEFLAHLSGAQSPEMLMMSGSLRVILATRHIPISKVPSTLTTQRIVDCTTRAAEAVRLCFGVRHPRIGVCGLNPHAGDGGVIGTEERRVILPAVRRLALRYPVQGPLAADPLLSAAAAGAYDLAVAMYHDQALIALKLHDPDKVVNMTIGLPFPRVSPGHGTAFDLVFQPNRIRLGPTLASMEILRGLLMTFPKVYNLKKGK
jgi:4-hydroxythreonine-4-phosphate dehydrogenase